MAFYCSCPEIGVTATDSSSYINYSFTLQSLGVRAPLYPLILRICQIIFRESRYLFVAVCIQIILSAISVFLLYKAVCIATSNSLISGIIAILYGCNGCILSWNISILSESLAISVSVFFLYAIVKYVKFPSFRNGTIAILMSLIATGVKPTLAVYSGICLVLLPLQFGLRKDCRLIVKKLTLVLGAVILLYIGYSYNNWFHWGTFNLTNLGPRHSLVPCLVTGCYQNYPDRSLVQEIEQIYNNSIENGDTGRGWETTTPIMQLFGTTAREQNINVRHFTSYCINTDRIAYIQYLCSNIIYWWRQSYSPYYYNAHPFSDISDSGKNPVFKIILFLQRDLPAFRIASGFYMIAFSLLLTIYQWIVTKQCPWFYLGVWGAATVIEFSVFLGSYGSFTRLTVYILPFLYFGWALIINDLALYMQKKSSQYKTA